jgi:hypothetical protein
MKKILVSLAIVALAMSTVALAGGDMGRGLVKVPLIKYSGPDFKGGMVVFNGGKEKVSIDAEIKGLTANYGYTVFLEINYGLSGWSYPVLGTITTDGSGNGKLESSYLLPAGTYILGLDIADHNYWAAEYVTDANKNGVWDGASDMQNTVTVDQGTGFDQFGYNYNARIFVGAADGYDRVLGNDPIYGNDHLVMKWSKAWDDARFHGALWTPDAWVDNEWNGMAPDGSSTTEHCKIVWVGPALETSLYWVPGGYAIWGEFEVLMDQGMVSGAHDWYAHATPNGYGAV